MVILVWKRQRGSHCRHFLELLGKSCRQDVQSCLECSLFTSAPLPCCSPGWAENASQLERNVQRRLVSQADRTCWGRIYVTGRDLCGPSSSTSSNSLRPSAAVSKLRGLSKFSGTENGGSNKILEWMYKSVGLGVARPELGFQSPLFIWCVIEHVKSLNHSKLQFIFKKEIDITCDTRVLSTTQVAKLQDTKTLRTS